MIPPSQWTLDGCSAYEYNLLKGVSHWQITEVVSLHVWQLSMFEYKLSHKFIRVRMNILGYTCTSRVMIKVSFDVHSSP